MSTVIISVMIVAVIYLLWVNIYTVGDIKKMDELLDSEFVWKSSGKEYFISVEFYNPELGNVVFTISDKKFKVSLKTWNELLKEGKIERRG